MDKNENKPQESLTRRGLLGQLAAFALALFGGAQAARAQGKKPWDSRMELAVDFEISQPDGGRYHRPYVAVWLEDATGKEVRTPEPLGGKRTWDALDSQSAPLVSGCDGCSERRRAGPGSDHFGRDPNAGQILPPMGWQGRQGQARAAGNVHAEPGVGAGAWPVWSRTERDHGRAEAVQDAAGRKRRHQRSDG